MLYSAMAPSAVSDGTREGIASRMLATKIWPSKTSKIHPSDAMISTSHW